MPVAKSLLTSGNELVRFRSATVALFQYGIREVMGIPEADDLGGGSIFT